MTPSRGPARLAAVLAVMLALSFQSVLAAELVMFRRDGCPYCLMWDREVGPGYANSELGKRAPLRMLDIDRDRHDIAMSGPVIYTPTFVLVDRGKELGRIEGYPGDAFFWGLLEHLLQRLPHGAASGLSVTP